MRGASTADAIDISPAAARATMDNAGINGVADLVHVSTTPLGEVDGNYDIVLANILAPTLVDLAGHLQRVTERDGVLVISGVLADRVDHVLAALAPMREVDRVTRDGWAAISLRW
jgi:ribosomal protein L11 methyltransferase